MAIEDKGPVQADRVEILDVFLKLYFVCFVLARDDWESAVIAMRGTEQSGRKRRKGGEGGRVKERKKRKELGDV